MAPSLGAHVQVARRGLPASRVACSDDVQPSGRPVSTDGSYDYVVIGSGAGGGPVAANLARAGMSVLLLEAGGDEENYVYQVPGFHGLATEDPALRWDFFVRHYGDDERQRRDTKYVPERDGVLYPRAGTLGGCTAHNAMITVCPHNADWNAIARITGDESWEAERMRAYFERLERCEYIDRPWDLPRNRLLRSLVRSLPLLRARWENRSRHGWDGWLGTTLADASLAIQDKMLLRVLLAGAQATLSDHLGRKLTPFEDFDRFRDPNDWRVEHEGSLGLWSTPLAVTGGRRNGTRELIRRVAAEHPDHLTVKTHALAARVLLDGNRAVGVEYLEGPHQYGADPQANGAPGTLRTATAAREVIVAAGAFNSPQLLMLSGIGPRDELEPLGIDVRVDLPGVGGNLQDRYELGVVYEMAEDFSVLEGCTFAPPTEASPDRCFRAWEDGRGAYTTNGVVVAIIRKSRPEIDLPDLVIFGVPAFFQGYYPGYSRELERDKNFFTWAILKARTKNTSGRVRLRSADPREPPEINFHYFEEGTDAAADDLEAMVTAVKFVRALMGRAGRVVRREVIPGHHVSSDDQIRDFVRGEAWGHHASCTCKIGPREDPYAVLDSSFKVHGAERLRVVDASAFPAIPGFFVVTAIYMIAEKASDCILETAAVAR
jgi:choline dehydrogenase